MNCPKCNQPITPEFFYCPVCGKKLKEKPVEATFGELVKLYLLSVLLPPFGLAMTLKYMRASGAKAKTAGWISLVLTILVLVLIFVWTTNQVTGLYEEINKQFGVYESLF